MSESISMRVAVDTTRSRQVPSWMADQVPSAWVLAALLLWAVAWTALPVWFDSRPSADNIEQLVWSQGLELGYHKHPPLPTWILIGAEQLFPPSLLLTYVLSILGMMVGGVFLWRLAGELLGKEAALPAVLATGCIAFFSYRAHVYNHNTVLVPFVCAAPWFFLRAVRSGRAFYWVLLGAVSAGGMLTKYQFVVVLATFVLIAARLRLYREPRAVRGVLIAAATATALLSAHVWWLVSQDFPPFRYASRTVLMPLGPLQRLDFSGGFLLQQLRDTLSPVLMLLLAARLSRRSAEESPSAAAITSHADDPPLNNRVWDNRVWIGMLGFAPIAVMLVLGLFGGVRLENHWGTTALQFVVLPLLAWMQDRKKMPALRAVLVMFVIVQAAQMVYIIVGDSQERQASLEHGRIRTFDPAALSHAVVDDWHQATTEPLRYVVGPTTWAGFVSLYSQEHPQVMISGDAKAAPWVSTEKLAQCGGVYIEPMQPPAGATVSRRGEWVTIDFSNAHRGEPLRIGWSVVVPNAACRGVIEAATSSLAGSAS